MPSRVKLGAEQKEEEAASTLADEEGWFVITGGLGGLGLHAAQVGWAEA